MENNIQALFGGRARAVEAASLNQTLYNLNIVGLDTSREEHAGLLDQRSIL